MFEFKTVTMHCDFSLPKQITSCTSIDDIKDNFCTTFINRPKRVYVLYAIQKVSGTFQNFPETSGTFLKFPELSTAFWRFLELSRFLDS